MATYAEGAGLSGDLSISWVLNILRTTKTSVRGHKAASLDSETRLEHDRLTAIALACHRVPTDQTERNTKRGALAGWAEVILPASIQLTQAA